MKKENKTIAEMSDETLNEAYKKEVGISEKTYEAFCKLDRSLREDTLMRIRAKAILSVKHKPNSSNVVLTTGVNIPEDIVNKNNLRILSEKFNQPNKNNLKNKITENTTKNGNASNEAKTVINPAVVSIWKARLTAVVAAVGTGNFSKPEEKKINDVFSVYLEQIKRKINIRISKEENAEIEGLYNRVKPEVKSPIAGELENSKKEISAESKKLIASLHSGLDKAADKGKAQPAKAVGKKEVAKPEPVKKEAAKKETQKAKAAPAKAKEEISEKKAERIKKMKELVKSIKAGDSVLYCKEKTGKPTLKGTVTEVIIESESYAWAKIETKDKTIVNKSLLNILKK